MDADAQVRREGQDVSALEPIEALLRARIGLEPASVGATWLASRVRARMEAAGVDGLARYAELARTSPEELAELAEEVVVPETWFFRDEAPFLLFARHVLSEWLPAHPGRPLRVLSVPCASGEEPYSIVMALLDVGLRPDQLRIDAVDLRRGALEQAQRGVYPTNSFRGDLLDFRSRYFASEAEGFALRPDVRDLVRFSQGNILDSDFAVGRLPYDVVFCRNLLIYLDRPARSRVRRTVAELLFPDGLLVSGKAETVIVWGKEFRPLPQVESCAYRLAGSEPAARFAVSRPAAAEKRRKGPTPARPEAPSPRPPAPRSGAADGGDERRAPVRPSLLARARLLADRGDLEGAEAACGRSLEESGPSADIFVLLAAIAGAKGEGERAESLLGRALYLEPTHVEALTLLALERQRRGDREGERVVRERLRRLTQVSSEGQA